MKKTQHIRNINIHTHIHTAISIKKTLSMWRTLGGKNKDGLHPTLKNCSTKPKKKIKKNINILQSVRQGITKDIDNNKE